MTNVVHTQKVSIRNGQYFLRNIAFRNLPFYIQEEIWEEINNGAFDGQTKSAAGEDYKWECRMMEEIEI